MDKKVWLICEERAKIIKALSHPARIFMVEELQKGERCVNELQEMIGYDMSTISKHLSILKNAGIVDDRREGTSSYYYLRVPCILNFFGCIHEVMQSNARQSNDIMKSIELKIRR
ncbi:MAG TPA: metalloregulator ArsR/SmtB family transcription factor [Spirochaetota bacterium]|nr:metalloregulator ArsR/SmtB family transcription factor [Spirochaetota bacterium]HPC42334.1 metalloregulator ArsR/SmtB family transcription factor [Spirochaetota bacterium]HPL17852.1 metalloregulator ArsR/SmtB family transcription factor [Spirochaetota bacterium]HQF10217.1 metalloregulator ArsR/SmtB family transcription factor [Spirochaetota bacterium]HQH99363.1 metalloregulator ArsR/SmtB family transcription factor [Spirochaetota bacterium]